MLVVDDIVKAYGDLLAVDGVSFEARAGQVFGLLGPNGAGKSTTINCISGLLRASSGSVSIAGHDTLREAREARRSLGVVPQELAIYEDLPAVDNLRFWGRAYGLRGERLENRVAEVLRHIGLGDRARERPETFSGGMKRRLNFGCGIVHEPRVILLDEPTVGVDPQSRERLFEMVCHERDKGACVVYTTHYMEEAERLCDALAIIDHGRVIARGSVDELRRQVGARDALQLNGHFPAPQTRDAILRLAAEGRDGLEILRESDDALTLTLTQASQHLPALFEAVAQAGGEISETNLKTANLETLFLTLTGKELRE